MSIGNCFMAKIFQFPEKYDTEQDQIENRDSRC